MTIGPSTQQDSDRSCFEVLHAHDELGALIRAHFQLEARLQRVVEWLTPHPRELPDLRYEQKAHVAVALGLDPRMLPAIKMLGHLRDNAVKYFDACLTDAAVNQLFGLLAKEDREAVLQLHRERAGSESVYQQASALQRFIAIAAIVDQFLQAAVAEARGIAVTSDEDHPEVVTFEWSAPPPRRAHDFATSEALYSYLIARDRS